jgi:plasmid stability protein
MATLNVKNFPDGLYRRLKVRAKKNHRSLSGEVTILLLEAMIRPAPKYTVDDLKGLGAGFWKGKNIQKWIDRERDSW